MPIHPMDPPYLIDQIIFSKPNLVRYLVTIRRTYTSELRPNTSLLCSTNVAKIGLPRFWLCRSCSPEFTASEFRPRVPDPPRSVHVYILSGSRQLLQPESWKRLTRRAFQDRKHRMPCQICTGLKNCTTSWVVQASFLQNVLKQFCMLLITNTQPP